MSEAMNQAEDVSASALPKAKQRYAKPVLSSLGSLRDLTMTISSVPGNKDGKSKRFTGRGGHCLLGDLRS